MATASYRLMPEIVVDRTVVQNELADELVAKCPMKVRPASRFSSSGRQCVRRLTLVELPLLRYSTLRTSATGGAPRPPLDRAPVPCAASACAVATRKAPGTSVCSCAACATTSSVRARGDRHSSVLICTHVLLDLLVQSRSSRSVCSRPRAFLRRACRFSSTSATICCAHSTH